MADMCKAKGKDWACDRTAVCNGYCNTHNMQIVRTGKVKPIGIRREEKGVKVTFVLSKEDRKKLGKHPSSAAAEIIRKALSKVG